MRTFICVGGTENGRQVHIKHGTSVQFLNSGSKYDVYFEPEKDHPGILVPYGLSREDIIAIFEERFPWFKARPTSTP